MTRRARLAMRWLAGAALGILVSGCVHLESESQGGGPWRISLPPIELATNEYIEAVELEIISGRVVSINRIPEDWWVCLKWDSPERLILNCEAGHFPAGLDDAKRLDGFVTVRPVRKREAGPDAPAGPADRDSFRVNAKLQISQAHPIETRDRNLRLSQSELVLTPER